MSFWYNDVMSKDDRQYIKLPLDISAKGLQTFTIFMDDYELHETGTKERDGKPTMFMTYKITRRYGGHR